MKSKKQKQRKTLRPSIIQKKSPSLKLNIFKYHQLINYSTKLPSSLLQSQSNNNIKLHFAKAAKQMKNMKKPQTSKGIGLKKFIQIQSEINTQKQQDLKETSPPQESFKSQQYFSTNFSKKLENSSTLKNLPSNSISLEESQCTFSQKFIRYKNFEFRSQKFLTLASQIKQGTITQNHEKKMSSIDKQIENLNKKSSTTKNAIDLMQKIKKSEKQKFSEKCKKFQDEIETLYNQINKKKIQLGHLFSYPQFKNKNLIPQMVILQKKENKSHLNYRKQKLNSLEVYQAQKLADLYLSEGRKQTEINHNQSYCSIEQNLSLNSKQ